MPEKPPFRWNAKLLRYIRISGRFVAWKDVRDALDLVLAKYTRDVRGWNDALRRGDISLTFWRNNMRQMIKETHLFATAAARGGWASMTQADYGRAGAMIKKEYAYLDRLTFNIATGLRPLDGNFQQYSVMYSQAARETYHETERNMRLGAGYRWERNVLHPADHCGGCLDASAQGWVRIGTLPPIGSRDCKRNCHCSFEYAKNRP